MNAAYEHIRLAPKHPLAVELQSEILEHLLSNENKKLIDANSNKNSASHSPGCVATLLTKACAKNHSKNIGVDYARGPTEGNTK